MAVPLETLERLAEQAGSPTSAPAKRMLVIVNPYATTVSDRLKSLVVYALRGRYEVDAVDTTHREHATELCREAAQEGYDVVVAFGGDGTVNEAANGLAGSDTALSCLPGGATNVFCQMLGIPSEIVDATEHLLKIADDWAPRQVDLANVNGRHFTFSSGLGLDASVVKRVDQHPLLKRRLGAYYFTYAGLTTFARTYVFNPPRLEVTTGGETVNGVTAIIQNGDPFTYFNVRPIRGAEGAELDSGDLSAIVLRRASPVDMPFILYRLFAGNARVVKHKHITGLQGLDELTVRVPDGRPVSLQVDGDFIGDVTEARYGITPGGLVVVS